MGETRSADRAVASSGLMRDGISTRSAGRRGVSVGRSCSAALTASMVRSGRAARMRATCAATCGHANDVPGPAALAAAERGGEHVVARARGSRSRR